MNDKHGIVIEVLLKIRGFKSEIMNNVYILSDIGQLLHLRINCE